LEKIIQQRSFQESDQKRADEPLPTFTEEIAPESSARVMIFFHQEDPERTTAWGTT
jgi:hypothetical protein